VYEFAIRHHKSHYFKNKLNPSHLFFFSKTKSTTIIKFVTYLYFISTLVLSQRQVECIYFNLISASVGRVAQSVQRLATGWAARESNPGGSEFFHTCPDRPWGPPSLLYNGYRVFPGGKERPGRDADPSPPSSAVVKKK